MAETDRRRAKQLAYNQEHGIEPRTIHKAVQDIMEGARSSLRRRPKPPREVGLIYDRMTPQQLLRRIEVLEKQMYKHARDLEFEEAAKIRDEIAHVRQRGLGLPEPSQRVS